MTAIYNLMPSADSSAQLTTINTNVDGLEAAVGTQADAASATGSLLARLGAIAAFIDQLEGFTDGIEGVLGTAVATPAANTINANLLRTLNAASNCSRTVAAQVVIAVAPAGSAATTLIGSANAGTDWRRVSIYNSGTERLLLGIGVTATASIHSFPLPPGVLIVQETLVNITALSAGAAGSCIVTLES